MESLSADTKRPWMAAQTTVHSRAFKHHRWENKIVFLKQNLSSLVSFLKIFNCLFRVSPKIFKLFVDILVRVQPHWWLKVQDWWAHADKLRFNTVKRAYEKLLVKVQPSSNRKSSILETVRPWDDHQKSQHKQTRPRRCLEDREMTWALWMGGFWFCFD